jgi:hypothetical protein
MNSEEFALWMVQNPTLFFVIVLVYAIWVAIWKGLALWKSARMKHTVWFIVLLIVNTVGILEILYIFVFSKIGQNKNKKRK